MADRILVLGDEAYSATMKQFTKAFGSPGCIVQALIHQLASRSTLSYTNWAGLGYFSDELVTMVQTQYAVELTSKLAERLHTDFLTKMWQQDRGTKYTVIHLSRWLKGKTGPAGLIILEKANRAKAVTDSTSLKERNHDRKTFPRKGLASGAPLAVKACCSYWFHWIGKRTVWQHHQMPWTRLVKNPLQIGHKTVRLRKLPACIATLANPGISWRPVTSSSSSLLTKRLSG